MTKKGNQIKENLVVVLFLMIFLVFNSCTQSQNQEIKEIEPELMHVEGVEIDANVKTTELSPGDTLNVFLTITNYLTSQIKLNITPIPTPYLSPKDENEKVSITLQPLSELYPGGYETKEKLAFSVESGIKEEKSFNLAVQYCYHVLYEKELPVCIDFVKAGYSKVPGCKFSPLVPYPEGSPVVIRKIDQQIKKYSDGYSVRFLVYIDAINKTIFFGNNCDDAVRYDALKVSLKFENNELTKLFYLDGPKGYVDFEFKLDPNQKQNYLSKLKVKLDYFVDDSVTLSNLHIIP